MRPEPLGHQVAFGGVAAVHVFGGLLEACRNRGIPAAVRQLAFDDDAGAVVGWPHDEQIRAHPTESVLPLHPTPAVDDALQERLQQKLRPRLPEAESIAPVLSVLAEERLEAFEQLVDVQRTVVPDVPRRFLAERLLHGERELARDYLLVYGVGNGDLAILSERAYFRISRCSRKGRIPINTPW